MVNALTKRSPIYLPIITSIRVANAAVIALPKAHRISCGGLLLGHAGHAGHAGH